MISPTLTLCNNCLWKSPCIYQLVVYVFLQDSEIYFLGQYFFKEKVRQKPNFLNISMKTIRFQDVCYNTCYSFLCETININLHCPFCNQEAQRYCAPIKEKSDFRPISVEKEATKCRERKNCKTKNCICSYATTEEFLMEVMKCIS